MSSKSIRKLRSILLYFFICILLSCTVIKSYANDIRVLSRWDDISLVHDYYLELLRLVLSKNQHLYPKSKLVFISSKGVAGGKEIVLLKRDVVDIIWSGIDAELELNYLPIRFPLFRGLLGYRTLLITQENKDKFLNIKSPEQLKKLVACHGAHWVDSDILESNGYLVARFETANLMLKMLVNKRCDYFPRAIFESVIEQKEAIQDFPNIILMDDIILHYDFGMFYFVEKNNLALAKRLKHGLMTALSDGSLMELMKSHEISRHLFPLTQWKNKRYFELSNNITNVKSPMKKNKLWLDLKDM